MAVPRQKHSKSRKRKRRTHDRISAPAISLCSQCGQPKEPHRICSHCGQYRGRRVIEADELS